ncbi:MAG TPA: DUF2461 domain-containing protein [Bryobacteraceae bacterium]|jgi:uncharacterized protein (TIGR02453 family)|nr:DUF2461 domain-containing protein [Bryobacteraceae bacterium]
MRSGFAGFPAEAITFYRGLARHNEREWFQPRKHIYDEKVKAPMVELVTELNRGMMSFAPDYVTDAPKAIYRIYRDTRFSPDKTPYKTHIAASFARRGMEKHGAAGYYFAISHKGVDVGGGIYMPPPETLQAVRTHIAGQHAAFRQLVAASAVKRLFGAMQGEQLTRPPKGFGAEHPAADLLRFKQFLLFTTLDAALVTTPKLFTELEKRFRVLAPFLEFLNAPLAGKRSTARREKWV